MKRFLLHAAILAALGGVVAFAIAALGLYDISATDQHLRPTYHLLRLGMDRSVALRARNLQPPPMDDPRRIARGADLFRDHCVQCHGGPGVAPEPFALALRPHATPLARSGLERSPQHLFWVVKHGIKMTGMPAWEYRFPEEDLWSVVAFVKHLPSLTPAQYQALPRTPAPPPAVAATAAPDPARGRKALEQYACIACHEIPGLVGPEARLGPTLHGIGSRKVLGGVLENTPENMATWLRTPQTIAPGTAMPNLGVTERDARDMAAHLATLR